MKAKVVDNLCRSASAFSRTVPIFVGVELPSTWFTSIESAAPKANWSIRPMNPPWSARRSGVVRKPGDVQLFCSCRSFHPGERTKIVRHEKNSTKRSASRSVKRNQYFARNAEVQRCYRSNNAVCKCGPQRKHCRETRTTEAQSTSAVQLASGE